MRRRSGKRDGASPAVGRWDGRNSGHADKRANLLALAAVLETDYELLFAESGAEAIKTLEKYRDVDVILMDVHMPDMDGFETATRVKKMKGAQDIPIIFVTTVCTRTIHSSRKATKSAASTTSPSPSIPRS